MSLAASVADGGEVLPLLLPLLDGVAVAGKRRDKLQLLPA